MTQTHKKNTMKNEQAQIELGLKYNLPLNVHSRNAGHHAIEMLQKNKIKKAILHAFDGKPKYAENAIKENGYYFSIAPIVCRSNTFQRLALRIDINHLLLETDAPGLAKEKSETNYPFELKYARDKIAEILKMKPIEITQITTRNAMKLFEIQ